MHHRLQQYAADHKHVLDLVARQAGFRDRRSNRLELFLRPGRDDDIGPRLGKDGRDGSTEATAGARDDRDAILQSEGPGSIN